MKKIILITLSVVLTIFVNYSTAQEKELSLEEQQLLMSYPELIMPDSYQSKSIPYAVDNSQLPYFRPMFSQAGMSCGQASSTGICFTYEMNRARNVPATTNTNLYPTHFVYDWAAGDWGSNGVSYYHTLDVLRTVGTPNLQEYGGTIDAGGNLRWMTGYDLYLSAMQNRVSSVYCIKNMNTAAGIQTLKNWMNDRLDGSEFGGCAIFYSTVPSPDGSLPAGTEEAGKYVITELYAGTSHSMALLGYNDSIRYDYNNDGQYTNNIDITGDGVVNVNDWEIGGFKMCNTYSGGPAWANGGFCYLTYKAVAGGAFWNSVVHVMNVNPSYEPTLTAKATVTHTNRKRIKIVVGMSTNLAATTPDYYIDFPIFDFQGGDRFMTGGTAEADKTIEFGLDITPFLNILTPGQTAKFFFKLTENDADAWGVGVINSFSVIDYSSGTPVETACVQSNVAINHNTTTMLNLTKTVNHSPPQITDATLPTGAIQSAYSHTLTANSGTPPYKWCFDTDYEISESTVSFPTDGTALSTSGFTLVNLGFSFPFAGSNFSNIYVSNTGLIVFQSGFSTSLPYNVDDDIVFLHTKCIAPYFTTSVTSTVKKQTGAGWILLSFDNSIIDYAVKLYANGDIEFYYQNSALTAQSIYTIGVSNGDAKNVQRLLFHDQTSIPNGFKYFLQAKLAPAEFTLSEDGVLTGTPTQEYVSVDFNFKVTDNNNLCNHKTLQFITDGLIMAFIPHTADDDIPEYAETVNLEIDAENPMASAATGITVAMSTSDSYITVTDASASLPNLNPGASTNQLNALQFNIAPNTPDQHEAIFQFLVDCDQNTWNYSRSFTINSPYIQPGVVSISDGNDNMLGAGETANVQVVVSNNGHATANQIMIELSTDDEYLTINTDPASITQLLPGSSSPAVFSVTSASSIPELHEATITMHITGDNGYTATETLVVTIYTPVITAGSLFVDDGSNFCLDAGETSDILIPLNNIGVINATNISVSLSTDDEYITINDGVYTTDAINSGNFANSVFNISVSPDAPMAHYVLFQLHITGDNGLDFVVNSATIIGIMIETFETGDLSAFEWTSGGSAPWYAVTDVVYDGMYSLRSGDISDGQSSVLSIQSTVVAAGDISFAYKVSSENYYDFLEFMVDGVVVSSWAGEQPWAVYSYAATTGTHTFAWRYRKDGSLSNGSDCGWIDNITFPAVNNIPSQFAVSETEIEKWMYTDDTDTDTLIISNNGGGFIDYDITLQFTTSKSTKNITGSSMTCNLETFVAGETYDIVFTAYNASTDSEWLKSLTLDFPEGFVVNSYTDFTGGSGGPLTSTDLTGDGASINWTTSQQWGTIYGGESATCTVNVTISESFGGQLANIAYILYGDIYGAEPHTLNGQIDLVNLNTYWLTITPLSGQLPFQSENEILLNYNTEGMANGYYYATININHNGDLTSIPVTLEIVSVDVPGIVAPNDIIFPNPFDNYIVVNTESNITGIKAIEITDLQGRIIYRNNNPTTLINGNNQLLIKTQHAISIEGLYFLRILSNEGTKSYKIIHSK